MRIQLRDTHGNMQPIPEGCRFVEICDEDGKIGCAIYQTDQGSVKVIYPSDTQDVERYEAIFNVKFCKRRIDIPIQINDHRNPSAG